MGSKTSLSFEQVFHNHSHLCHLNFRAKTYSDTLIFESHAKLTIFKEKIVEDSDKMKQFREKMSFTFFADRCQIKSKSKTYSYYELIDYLKIAFPPGKRVTFHESVETKDGHEKTSNLSSGQHPEGT